MKKINTICLLVLIAFYNHICFANEQIKIDLVKIIDGDTIIGQIDNNQFPIRLIGIDCYETSKINRAYKQAYNDKLTIDEIIEKGVSSKKYIKELYKKSDKNVYFEFKGLDSYKRVLGIVYFDTLNINTELVNKNLCNIYNYK